MPSNDDFWKEMYKDDAIGYEEHLKIKAETYLEMERTEQMVRNKVSKLFMATSSSEVEDHISHLSAEDLLTHRWLLKHLTRDIESQYHRLMNETVFSKSKVTFKELVSRNNWDGVRQQLLNGFVSQENLADSYEGVFKELQRLSPVANEDSLVITMDYFEEEDGYNILGLKPNDIEKYALDFSPWENWLGYYINQKDLDEHSEEKIIAHCLWEMTFDGLTQEDIKKSADELASRLIEEDE